MSGTQGSGRGSDQGRTAHSRPVRGQSIVAPPAFRRSSRRAIVMGAAATLTAFAMVGVGAATWASGADAVQTVTGTQPRLTSVHHAATAAVHTSSARARHAAAPAPKSAARVNCNVKKCIALTFDDGPGPYTHKLLGELAAAHVNATFFLIGGNVGHYPSQVRAELAGGNVVGNHSWSHPQLTLLSPAAIGREVDRTQAAIHKAAGYTPTLMRPPYGAVNGTVLTQLGRRDLAAILWNVDTEDWKNRSVSITTQRALAGARPGAIILMHDIHPTTVQAAPGIIRTLKARGYTLVTVPQLLGNHVTPGHKYFNR